MYIRPKRHRQRYGEQFGGRLRDNQAAPLTLFQFAPTGTTSVSFATSLVLPHALMSARADPCGHQLTNPSVQQVSETFEALGPSLPVQDWLRFHRELTLGNVL
jgi:hypothetical protein